LKSNIRTREINKLIKNGNKVQGIITQIVNSGGWTGNNRAFFYKLIVTSPNSNSSVSQTFISDKVTDFNPLSLEKNNQIPVPIDVYIDKVNPKKYYVDISQLPSKSNNILSQNLTLSYDNKNNSLIIDLEK